MHLPPLLPVTLLDLGDVPAAGVQTTFWYVVAALGLLGAGFFLARRISKWGRDEVLEIVAGKLDAAVDTGVAKAMEAHEKREQTWRSEDRASQSRALDSIRQEFRDDLREFKNRLGDVEREVRTLIGRPYYGQRRTDADPVLITAEIDRLQRLLVEVRGEKERGRVTEE